MTYLIIDLQNLDYMHITAWKQSSLGKLACEVKANDARLGKS